MLITYYKVDPKIEEKAKHIHIRNEANNSLNTMLKESEEDFYWFENETRENVDNILDY
ncbi:hypothetical protein HOG21_01010 [bacterium]|jgi:hypothetical protein|nr:hypothetical protein [bacterium]